MLVMKIIVQKTSIKKHSSYEEQETCKQAFTKITCDHTNRLDFTTLDKVNHGKNIRLKFTTFITRLCSSLTKQMADCNIQ